MLTFRSEGGYCQGSQHIRVTILSGQTGRFDIHSIDREVRVLGRWDMRISNAPKKHMPFHV